MIEITDKIARDEAEIVATFIRASSPGGQMNKVSSAAQLRFNVRRSPIRARACVGSLRQVISFSSNRRAIVSSPLLFLTHTPGLLTM